MGFMLKSGRPTGRLTAMRAARLLSSASLLVLPVALFSSLAAAQAPAATQAYDIAAQPLSGALRQYKRVSGIQVVFASADGEAVTSAPVKGSYTPQAALAQLLAGTGLTYQFTSADTATIEKAPAANGAIQLGTVRVEGTGNAGAGATLSGTGAGDGSPETAPYRTAGAANYISAEHIERYRGSSPADILRGTPGVLSGEARNGAGSIDVNIRGLQGMGRVTTTIDGAENAVNVYQGYQGVSNRTFVDPDFIASIDITKGADAAAFGNAGSVSMRTIGASDIVKPGETWGLRIRGGLSGNTSSPVTGNVAGYAISNPLGWEGDPTNGFGSAVASPTGLDRPDALKPTSGSASIAAAYKGETIELLAAYAYRDQGNYHAGEDGPTAVPVHTGPRPFCYSNGTCPPEYLYRDYVELEGPANYRAGEEVLNSELRTESWLTKMTSRFGDGHVLQLGYTGFRSEAGDRLASRLGSTTSRAQQQAQTAGTSLDTYTARYRWKPDGSDLIDLKSNFYWSHLELRNTIRGGRLPKPTDIGLLSGFRVGSDSDMWGADVSNLSKFFTAKGDVDLTYGLAYRGEDARGSQHTAVLEGWTTPRDGLRQEVAAYVKSAWTPVDWATLNAGLRYTRYWTKDRFDPYERQQTNYSPKNFKASDDGFSPSIGLTFKPSDSAQIYINYAHTLRLPSLMESVSAFNSVRAQTGLKPERTSGLEIGTNLTRKELFGDDDQGFLKLSYFDWNIRDYLARDVIVEPTITLDINNIYRARLSGLELSSRYQTGGFTAELGANYFTKVEFCRTATTCESKSLYGDYATNQVPPEYTLDLSLSQKLFGDRLTVGGRATHTGPRAIGHGDETARGAASFIALVDWDPYTLIDAFADYKINDRLTAAFRVENVTDQFYVDPLGLVTQPGPGRTVYASLTTTFGGGQALSWLEPLRIGDGDVNRNWTGFYAGVHGGGNYALERGTATQLNGATSVAASRESAKEDMTSGLFGLQGGYNYQFGNGLVLGIEADYSKTYLQDEQKIRSTVPAKAAVGEVDSSYLYDIDRMSSVRARIGYALNRRALIYATAGIARARETQWRDQYIDTYYEQVISFTEKAQSSRDGVTTGFGVEYALSDRWSVRADYSYSQFKAKDFKFAKARAGTDPNWTETISTIIGSEIIDYANDPNMVWICDIVPELCIPFEQPIYEHTYIEHIGGATTVEGRIARNKLDLHAIKFGLNYRF